MCLEFQGAQTLKMLDLDTMQMLFGFGVQMETVY